MFESGPPRVNVFSRVSSLFLIISLAIDSASCSIHPPPIVPVEVPSAGTYIRDPAFLGVDPPVERTVTTTPRLFSGSCDMKFENVCI